MTAPTGQHRFTFFVTVSRHVLFLADGVILWASSFFPERRMQIPDVGRGVAVQSGRRRLAGWWVAAESPVAAILLCHGIGDRMEYWRAAQQALQRHGISSVIFHYSGYARSEGPTTPENLPQDVDSGYRWLLRQVGAGIPCFVLGFSMGTGIVAEVAPLLTPPPAGVMLCQAYTGFRAAAGRVVRPLTALSRLVPDIWRTATNVQRLRVPLLLLHGVRDPLFPLSMAEEIERSAAAAGVEVRLVQVSGCSHNSVYRHVPDAYWEPILDFMRQSRHRPAGCP